MKHAHSIPLGHLVEAGNVPHATTMDKRALVICPACDQPVTAVHRSEQHFFAHQRGTGRDQVAECELRVVRLAQEARSSDAERTARQGNLKFFLAIIDRMSLQALSGYAALSSREINMAIRTGLLPILLRGYGDTLREKVAAKGIGVILKDDDLKRFDAFTRHAFGAPMLTARHQRSYAEDMLKTLLTEPCAPQLLRVLMTGYMATLAYLSRLEDQEPGSALHGTADAMWQMLDDPDMAAGPRGVLATAMEPFYHGMNMTVIMTTQIMLAIDYGGWLERRSTDATLRRDAKAAMTVAPARPKRKPKPKKTHRKPKVGRARRAA